MQLDDIIGRDRFSLFKHEISDEPYRAYPSGRNQHQRDNRIRALPTLDMQQMTIFLLTEHLRGLGAVTRFAQWTVRDELNTLIEEGRWLV